MNNYRLPLQIGGYAGRRHSNLALGLILLPRAHRADAFLFYDFCRAVDDLADSGTETPERRKEQLSSWIEALQPGNEEQLPGDFAEMIQRRQLDRQLLLEIVLGMQMDTEQCRYPTFSELRRYCWRAASAVGLVSAALFGASGDAVKDYATELGLALQLTNILRDVREDAGVNRIYIPLEDLERFGVTEEEILERSFPSHRAEKKSRESRVEGREHGVEKAASANAVIRLFWPSTFDFRLSTYIKGRESREDSGITHLFNHQAERADSYFAKAELAWVEMSPNQKRLMRPARLMSAIYRDLLLQMHQDRYDVFGKNYRVSRIKKLLLALRVLIPSFRDNWTF
jgi:phytoene/squalene synthetase